MSEVTITTKYLSSLKIFPFIKYEIAGEEISTSLEISCNEALIKISTLVGNKHRISN